jgi:hypothetical protein
MHTSRFQLALTTTLAIGLGATGAAVLIPQTAVGYPAGASVSTGTNPVDAWAGTVGSSTTSILTAPADQDIVVTDVHLSCNYMCETRVTMTRSDGTTVGSFWVSGGYGSSYDSLSVQQQFSSGIPVPAGQNLSLQSSSGTIAYTLSGYLAQP